MAFLESKITSSYCGLTYDQGGDSVRFYSPIIGTSQVKVHIKFD